MSAREVHYGDTFSLWGFNASDTKGNVGVDQKNNSIGIGCNSTLMFTPSTYTVWPCRITNKGPILLYGEACVLVDDEGCNWNMSTEASSKGYVIPRLRTSHNMPGEIVICFVGGARGTSVKIGDTVSLDIANTPKQITSFKNTSDMRNYVMCDGSGIALNFEICAGPGRHEQLLEHSRLRALGARQPQQSSPEEIEASQIRRPSFISGFFLEKDRQRCSTRETRS